MRLIAIKYFNRLTALICMFLNSLMLPFQEIKPFIFLWNVYCLTMFDACQILWVTTARRWATVSIWCRLCKSPPCYIILWFVCTEKNEAETCRQRPRTPAPNLRWTRYSPIRNTGSKTKRKASFWPRSDLKLIDFVSSADLTASHLH